MCVMVDFWRLSSTWQMIGSQRFHSDLSLGLRQFVAFGSWTSPNARDHLTLRWEEMIALWLAPWMILRFWPYAAVVASSSSWVQFTFNKYTQVFSRKTFFWFLKTVSNFAFSRINCTLGSYIFTNLNESTDSHRIKTYPKWEGCF